MQIVYQEVDTALCDAIVSKYGELAKKHVHVGAGCYSLTALFDGVPVGVLSVYTRNLATPLEDERDAYIDVIELDEDYRRMGIATQMLARAEAWAKEAGLLQICAWSSRDKVEAISMWRSLGYGLCPAKIWVEWCQQVVDGYYAVKQLNPVNPYPDITKRIRQDLQCSAEMISNFRLIRAKQGVYVYRCLYNEIPAVAKYFEHEDDKRELLNYHILTQYSVPTIKLLGQGSSTLVMEDIAASQEWRLGVAEDMADTEVAIRLANWYFTFHERGIDAPELKALYFEFDHINRESLEMLKERLPDASELFEYVLARLEKLHSQIYKPAFTLTYNDFYWVNLVVRKDKSAAMMFDYNQMGKGYRRSDFSNVCSSLSQDAGAAFVDEYARLYAQKHGHSREDEESLEKQIDDFAAPLFALIAAYQQQTFPQWAEHSKKQALDGTLLGRAKLLLT